MEQRKIDLSKPVKFIKPLNQAEAKLIFKVVNYNEVTNRVYIQPLNINLIRFCKEVAELFKYRNTDRSTDY